MEKILKEDLEKFKELSESLYKKSRDIQSMVDNYPKSQVRRLLSLSAAKLMYLSFDLDEYLEYFNDCKSVELWNI